MQVADNKGFRGGERRGVLYRLIAHDETKRYCSFPRRVMASRDARIHGTRADRYNGMVKKKKKKKAGEIGMQISKRRE